jgi:hypothetical protein
METDMYHSSVLKESAPLQRPRERHRPEKTSLYRIIDRYYPEMMCQHLLGHKATQLVDAAFHNPLAINIH